MIEDHQIFPRGGAQSVATIEDAKALQRERGLMDRHVVHIGHTAFVVAHTDKEREAAKEDGLYNCPLHAWLESLDGPPHPVGWYAVDPHVPDAYSEPYGIDPWDFEPLEHDHAV